jgi:hypothetical protein
MAPLPPSAIRSDSIPTKRLAAAAGGKEEESMDCGGISPQLGSVGRFFFWEEPAENRSTDQLSSHCRPPLDQKASITILHSVQV